MLRHTFPVLFSLAVGGILAGCDLLDSPVEPDVAHLVIRLSVQPEKVESGDPVVVRLQMINTGRDTAVITSNAECFGSLVVYRDAGVQNEPAPVEPKFAFDSGACWTMPSSPVTLAPEEALRATWHFHAADSSGLPLEEGKYQLTIDLEGRLDGASVLPDVRRELAVEQSEVD